MSEQITQESAPGALAFGFEIRDPEKFAQNMVRLIEETGKAVTAFVEPRMTDPMRSVLADDFSPIMTAFSRIQQAWILQPQQLIKAQADLWQCYWQLWTSTLASTVLAGSGSTPPVMAPDPKDTRFRDSAWSQNRYFDFMKQAYLINSKWAEQLVESAESLDPDSRQKAGFYMKQMINALAPSNWVFSNPELLRETFASDGENLVRGMQFLAEDIKRGGGDLQIRQTDFSKFEVG
jgi:polyhydroxyalkanoate synthase